MLRRGAMAHSNTVRGSVANMGAEVAVGAAEDDMVGEVEWRRRRSSLFIVVRIECMGHCRKPCTHGRRRCQRGDSQS